MSSVDDAPPIFVPVLAVPRQESKDGTEPERSRTLDRFRAILSPRAKNKPVEAPVWVQNELTSSQGGRPSRTPSPSKSATARAMRATLGADGLAAVVGSPAGGRHARSRSGGEQPLSHSRSGGEQPLGQPGKPMGFLAAIATPPLSTSPPPGLDSPPSREASSRTKELALGAELSFDFDAAKSPAGGIQITSPQGSVSVARPSSVSERLRPCGWSSSFSTSMFIDADLLLSASSRSLLPPSDTVDVAVEPASPSASTSSPRSGELSGDCTSPSLFRTPSSFLDVDKQFWGDGHQLAQQTSLATTLTSSLPPLFQLDRTNARADEWLPPELPACDTVDIGSIALASGDDWMPHYAMNYSGRPHGLYVGYSPALKTFVVAVRPKIDATGRVASLSPAAFLASLEDDDAAAFDTAKSYFVLIVSQFGAQRHIFTFPSAKQFVLGKPLRRELPTAKTVASVLSAQLKVPVAHLHSLKRPAAFAAFAEALANYESRIVANGHKFGLLYCRAGQRTEADYFRNRHEAASPAYLAFLQWLGAEILLEGYPGYAGGLDTRNNTTGATTVAGTLERNNRKKGLLAGGGEQAVELPPLQIVFHVPTLMPFVDTCSQAIERKRHVGNDIVCLVFQDRDAEPFDPTCVLTTFIHVYIVVRELADDMYHVGVVNKDHIVPFGPPLPAGEVFHKDMVFRKWLYHKLVNAERAAFYHPHFRNPLTKSRQLLLHDLVQTALYPNWPAAPKKAKAKKK